MARRGTWHFVRIRRFLRVRSTAAKANRKSHIERIGAKHEHHGKFGRRDTRKKFFGLGFRFAESSHSPPPLISLRQPVTPYTYSCCQSTHVRPSKASCPYVRLSVLARTSISWQSLDSGKVQPQKSHKTNRCKT